MNDKRRKQLIGDAVDLIEQGKSMLEQAQEEEQASFDNMPEGLQQNEKGQTIEENANQLGDAIGSLDEAINVAENLS